MASHVERIQVLAGDITRLGEDVGVEGIVNAANQSLLGGGGVDGAIHRAAGRRLLEHNRTLGGCPTGHAKITPAFDLEARGIRHIIHTVGPVWHGTAEAERTPIGKLDDDGLLGSCYLECLKLAETHTVKVVAFPGISTGVYHFPKERAAKIAVRIVREWLDGHAMPQRVVFCCFAEGDAAIYRQVLSA